MKGQTVMPPSPLSLPQFSANHKMPIFLFNNVREASGEGVLTFLVSFDVILSRKRGSPKDKGVN